MLNPSARFQVPYFDATSLQEYLDCGVWKDRHYQELERLYRKSSSKTEDLHFPCTLDQSYYLSLDDSTERDTSQVVVKYADFQNRRTKGNALTQIIGQDPIGSREKGQEGDASGLNQAARKSTKLLMVN